MLPAEIERTDRRAGRVSFLTDEIARVARAFPNVVHERTLAPLAALSQLIKQMAPHSLFIGRHGLVEVVGQRLLSEKAMTYVDRHADTDTGDRLSGERYFLEQSDPIAGFARLVRGPNSRRARLSPVVRNTLENAREEYVHETRHDFKIRR